MCAASTRQTPAVARPGPRVAHAAGDLRVVDRAAHPEHDERDREVPQHQHADVLLVELEELEHARAVGGEVAGLVDHLAVGADGQELGMEQPVERVDVGGELRRLQRPLGGEYVVFVAH